MELDRGGGGAAYVTSSVWLAGRETINRRVMSNGEGVTCLVPWNE